MSPELVTHTLTVTTPTYIDNTQSVAPSGDTNVTLSKPEAASNVSLEDLYCKPTECLERQNNDKNSPDYFTALGPTMAQENDTYTEISQTSAENRDVRSKVESAQYVDMGMYQTKDSAEGSQKNSGQDDMTE